MRFKVGQYVKLKPTADYANDCGCGAIIQKSTNIEFPITYHKGLFKVIRAGSHDICIAPVSAEYGIAVYDNSYETEIPCPTFTNGTTSNVRERALMPVTILKKEEL